MTNPEKFCAEELAEKKYQLEHEPERSRLEEAYCAGASARAEYTAKVVREVREIVSLCHPGIKAPPSHPLAKQSLHRITKEVGEIYGYGALMNAASYEWAQSLKAKGYPEGGAFTLGPCPPTVEEALRLLETLAEGEK